MTRQDTQEFQAYLRQCSDRQVVGVYETERDAGREDYQALAELEAARRGIEFNDRV